MSTPPGAQFLDPRVLARIDNLELLARTVVDGFLNGLHRAPYLGLSMDFAEHRPYVPGDDTRHLDWRLYARTDRHYVKQYEAETNANVFALLDVSASMEWKSDPEGVTKLDYARYLTACLLHFSRRQRDRVGLATFDGGVDEWVPASAKNLELALHVLHRAAGTPGDRGGPSRVRAGPEDGPDGDTGDRGTLRPALLTAAERLSRRGIVLVVSDFYEPADRASEALRLVLGRGHDVVVFHVLDPAEVEFPYADTANFLDVETGEEMPVLPGRVGDRYRALVSDHLQALQEACTGQRIDYVRLDTSAPLDHALFTYLKLRERRVRVR